jgi:O-methyltransferase
MDISTTPVWFVDVVNADIVSGWLVSDPASRIDVEVSVNGRVVGHALRGLPRPDVKQQFADRPGAADSGFAYVFAPGDLTPASENTVAVRLSGQDLAPHVTRVPVVTSATHQREQAIGPLPAPVLALLTELSPQYRTTNWSDDLMASAVEDVIWLWNRGSKKLKGLYPYLRYLSAMHQHARLVERHYPRANRKRSLAEKDGATVQSSWLEMIAIAHHLCVLDSYDVGGVVLEFGCFKGFSTSVLSYACGLLNRPMHVFDSFAGLPPSPDGYYQAGDFAGDYEEVVGNVTEFGAARPVTFHRGFFSDTVPVWTREPVACVWMDVDLESSARDALVVIDSLDRRGALFSHECAPANFEHFAPRSAPGPSDVVQPIVDAFTGAGRSPRGRFISGNTGAFWDNADGIPVLSPDALWRLSGAARSLAD